MHELRKLLSKAFLGRLRDAGVGSGVEAGGGDFGCEPVGFGEADDEGDEVLFDVFGFQLGADLV